jgi:1-acyl-sn-glycerol-3-phosphate acyltransferase
VGRDTIFAHQHLPKPDSKWRERMLYWLAKLICMGLFSTGIIPVKVTGRENLKGLGACIAVANHVDGIDAPVLIKCLPFTTWFLLRDDFGEPIKSLLTRLLLMVHINREKPKPSQFRKAVGLLRSGRRLTMFPEGHRSESGALNQAKHGLVSLARSSEVPVVPISISGSLNFLRKETWRREIIRAVLRRRPPIEVTIHAPIYLKNVDRESEQSAIDEIMNQIASGLRKEQQGVYAN